MLAIERSYGNHHWFCEKACDMATRTARSKKAETDTSKQETNRTGFFTYQ